VASTLGLAVDTLAVETDHPGVRYSGGLFWAPGIDLVGQRRILGFGAATQFDTRIDRESLMATPLVLFLPAPSRVDTLIDGRLVDSRTYAAGNNVLDTSHLPDGSYMLTFQVHDPGGAVREETRFFSKNRQVAPLGAPIYFAYVGLLSKTRPDPAVSVSKRLFYQVGAARRLSRSLALDASLIGTDSQPVVEAGAWVFTASARVRVAGLASANGAGALVQVASTDTGPLAFNFDLRRVWSRSGEDFIPRTEPIDTFGSNALRGRRVHGNSTQLTGNVGYSFGNGYLGLVGSLWTSRGEPYDYTVGPTLQWSILNRGALQVALQADAQLSRSTSAAYVGIRLFTASGRMSVSATTALKRQSSDDFKGLNRTRGVGDVTASVSFEDQASSGSASAGVTRDIDSTIGHAQALFQARMGVARVEFAHEFEGEKRSQFAASVQTGLIVNGQGASLGGREASESAIIVSVDGVKSSDSFDVIIDGQVRGRVTTGGRLPIFLEPYRSYFVKLRPTKPTSLWFDAADRKVTLYPGTVRELVWKARALHTVFGRAVTTAGVPVADAVVKSEIGIGHSDANGQFQVDVSDEAAIKFQTSLGGICTVGIAAISPATEYVPLGEVICR
jgi:hypothetical protein